MEKALYWEDPNPAQDGNLGTAINLYQDNKIKHATSLSNLIRPSITGSNTITFGLEGNLDIIRPSDGSSLACFNDMGITMNAPMTVNYKLYTDGLEARGFVTGTGKTRLLEEVDNTISKFSYPRGCV